jgi:hypothetical protein
MKKTEWRASWKPSTMKLTEDAEGRAVGGQFGVRVVDHGGDFTINFQWGKNGTPWIADTKDS